ncbi:hypothetical protein C0991_005851 [Blastosporella zonata]|nr:hypothetical protein C0991_005851 [Blastosporella zonata]
MASPTATPATESLGTPFRSLEATEPASAAALTLRTTKVRPGIYELIDVNRRVALSAPASLESLPITKSTPHLSAILARAATRTRKALPFKFSTPAATLPLPSTADYRPSSLPAFLERLATFKLSTYANKPSIIDAVAASKCGWINDGKDRLVCGLCRGSWVVAGRDKMSKDAATIYCIPLQSPATMVKDIKINATALDPWLRDIEIKHPLTSTQITSLQSTLSAVTIPPDTPGRISNPSASTPDQGDDDVFMSEDQARRLGLWAFSPESPTSSAEPHPTAATPRRDSTDTDTMMESAAESSHPTAASFHAVPLKKGHTRRPFDILKEHRAYCPYVVRSTIVPTLPTPPTFSVALSSNPLPRAGLTSVLSSQNSALEGWRAVLTVVLRYGAGQRHRLGLDFADRLRGDKPPEEAAEVDSVKAMIAGVKKRGGKDLLQYVKGLLG